MSAPISPAGLPARFWETKSLAQMDRVEWEALCDGCGKCCLNKLEDEDSGEIALTSVSCRLFDDGSCRCSSYEDRHDFVPECIVLTAASLHLHMHWLPRTCAYRLLSEGRALFDWHPLISGDPTSVHRAGVSMQDSTVNEADILLDDWEAYIIEEPF